MDDLTRLFLAARDGDRTALLHAVRESQADVWRLASHLVGPDDADDVTQDTFVRAWRALPAFRGDSSARTWLLAIARRACADAVRGGCAAAGSPNAPRASATVAASTQIGDPTGAHDVHALIGALDNDQRAAFVLTQVVGCSYAEAASICGVPVGTIRSRVARARERLLDAGARSRNRMRHTASLLARGALLALALACTSVVIAGATGAARTDSAASSPRTTSRRCGA